MTKAALVLLAGHVASAPGLETDDDVGDLHVPLLLQVSQDSGPEEHFALADAVQVGIQLQRLDLILKRRRQQSLSRVAEENGVRKSTSAGLPP